MDTLSNLVRVAVDLCRLRRGPQDVPHSPNLFGALIVASVVLDLLVGHLLGDGADVLPRSLLSTAIVLALCWIALAIRRLRNRYVQTATALLACGVLLSLLQVPLAWLAGPPPADANALVGLQIALGWLALAVFVWQLAVDAHIMRHAIESSWGLAFALVVSWVLAYWALERLLFGAV